MKKSAIILSLALGVSALTAQDQGVGPRARGFVFRLKTALKVVLSVGRLGFIFCPRARKSN